MVSGTGELLCSFIESLYSDLKTNCYCILLDLYDLYLLRCSQLSLSIYETSFHKVVTTLVNKLQLTLP